MQMSPRKRIIILIMIMTTIVIASMVITVVMLYRTAITEEKAHLEETVKSQARLIEAVARFDQIYSKDYPYGAREASLYQIKDAHSRYRGFGETGEFTLSTKENNQIVFLLCHRHSELENPKPIPWDSGLAEPMRLALSGKSGTVIGVDYRGKTVLAAYEPVDELDLGIVAKIDLSEIRTPFIQAILVSGLFSIVLIALGVSLFFKISNPILKGLYDTVSKLEHSLKEVKRLRGILPICSFCKKIRDDEGYWRQVENYINERSDAEFSHSICPDCLKKHYPELSDAYAKNNNTENGLTG
ncbi:MAG: hypothetical protein D3910_06090 [Candidatus Electrothrix sp. ATG2]|nr:hypothetical protein [Candidatus Electrothrix sp. ATG2]